MSASECDREESYFSRVISAEGKQPSHDVWLFPYLSTGVSPARANSAGPVLSQLSTVTGGTDPQPEEELWMLRTVEEALSCPHGSP